MQEVERIEKKSNLSEWTDKKLAIFTKDRKENWNFG